MKWKYVIGKSTNPYYNLAMEQFLFQKADKGIGVLFLWQNDNTIVIGRNQSIEAECKLEEFLSNGGRIARRHSGGGAVYHDMGNLNFSIISKIEEIDECRYQNVIMRSLADLGICTEFNGRNDLLVQGKKFSGNAFYNSEDIICQHGTLLVSSDINKMNRFLTPEKDKLERNRVYSVSSRVINLVEINPELTIEIITNTIINVTGAEPLEFNENADMIETIASRYENKSWIFGRKFE